MHTLSDDQIKFIAKECHNNNMLFCRAVGDHSQVEWDQAPDNIKQSAIAGVTYFMSSPTSESSDQHEAWMAFKLKDGWVYGETKDEDKKTHPCLVPYDQLPLDQQFKDYLFRLSCITGAAMLLS